ITSLDIEIIKDLLDRFHAAYNSSVLAAIASFIIGSLEMIAYYIMNHLEITAMTLLYCVCMGIANMVSAAVGYDKVRELITAFLTKNR
ncbi:MAG: hypothetical protein K2O73_01250, partial [Lachnospiraceae bacterium]|nr:hypothetical protein [Lachnospiraceae bacterium]